MFLMGRRQFVLGAFTTCMLFSLFGCSKKTTDLVSMSRAAQRTTGAVDGGTIRFALDNPLAIDPAYASDIAGITVVQALFDPLTFFDYKNKQLIPLACESWESNMLATEYMFHIRKGMMFHNGDPVLSNDFKYAWERAALVHKDVQDYSQPLKHLSRISGFREMIRGERDDLDIHCPDDQTLVIRLSSPYADFPIVVSHPFFAPVPSGGAASDPKEFFYNPVGNGPFSLEGRWADGQSIRVKRYENYHGQRAHVSGIEFVTPENPDQEFKEFELGSLDCAAVPLSKIKDATSSYGLSYDGYTINPDEQVLRGSENGVTLLLPNLTDPLLSNVNLRQALSLLINRKTMSEAQVSNARMPATDLIPACIPGHRENGWPSATFDVMKARELLDNNGFPETEGLRNLTLTVLCNEQDQHDETIKALTESLQAVGINCIVDKQEWSSYVSLLKNRSFQLALINWTSEIPTMDSYLAENFMSVSENNLSGYVDEQFDRLILDAQATIDDKERVKLNQAASDLIEQAVGAIPLMFYQHAHVGSARLNNLYIGPNSIPQFAQSWVTDGQ